MKIMSKYQKKKRKKKWIFSVSVTDFQWNQKYLESTVQQLLTVRYLRNKNWNVTLWLIFFFFLLSLITVSRAVLCDYSWFYFSFLTFDFKWYHLVVVRIQSTADPLVLELDFQCHSQQQRRPVGRWDLKMWRSAEKRMPASHHAVVLAAECGRWSTGVWTCSWSAPSEACT